MLPDFNGFVLTGADKGLSIGGKGDGVYRLSIIAESRRQFCLLSYLCDRVYRSICGMPDFYKILVSLHQRAYFSANLSSFSLNVRLNRERTKNNKHKLDKAKAIGAKARYCPKSNTAPLSKVNPVKQA